MRALSADARHAHNARKRFVPNRDGVKPHQTLTGSGYKKRPYDAFDDGVVGPADPIPGAEGCILALRDARARQVVALGSGKVESPARQIPKVVSWSDREPFWLCSVCG